MIDTSDFIGVHEASKKLKIHEESLRRIIRIGTVPAIKIGGQWFIDKNELETFAKTYNPKTGKVN